MNRKNTPESDSEKDCGMCRHFCAGPCFDFDQCGKTGEPRECYEQPCKHFEE